MYLIKSSSNKDYMAIVVSIKPALENVIDLERTTKEEVIKFLKGKEQIFGCIGDYVKRFNAIGWEERTEGRSLGLFRKKGE